MAITQCELHFSANSVLYAATLLPFEMVGCCDWVTKEQLRLAYG